MAILRLPLDRRSSEWPNCVRLPPCCSCEVVLRGAAAGGSAVVPSDHFGLLTVVKVSTVAVSVALVAALMLAWR